MVGNGEIDIIKQCVSSLTWLEEWFLYLEYQNRKSITRLVYLEAGYGIDTMAALAIVNQMEFCALNSWPKYASYEEDMILRCKDKWVQYDKTRLIMWDMTNVPAFQFTDSDLQRLTYSKYYGQCCFKGGVFTQLMGWQVVGDLWTGKVTDTDYTKHEGLLQLQCAFQESNKVIIDGEERILPFLIIFNKGFQVNLAAWPEGQQLVLQPDFSASDRRFS